ncbi:MAG: hypothetical protein EXS36_01750 [Pedosphaera sp.]|nr:hypothetical protein [Pedosphaera sp.]
MKSSASFLTVMPPAQLSALTIVVAGLVMPGFTQAAETNSAITNAVSAAQMTVPLSTLSMSRSLINADAMRQRLVPRSYTLDDEDGVARYLFREPKLFKFWQVLNPFAPRSMGTPPSIGTSYIESRPMPRVFVDDKTREAGGISVFRFSW